MTAASAAWRDRYLAPTVGYPLWSAHDPELLVYISNEGGVTQAWILDRSSGERRPITAQPIGVEDVLLTADGRGAIWWSDDSGDECGSWQVTSLTDGSVQPLLTGLPEGWSQGVAVAGPTVAVAIDDDVTYRVVVSVGGEQAKVLVESTKPLGLGREWEITGGGLSTDGELVCYRNSDLGDMLHFGLRVVSARSGETFDELFDEGLTLKVGSWSPVNGDQRLAVIHERDGIERPAIWEPLARIRTNLSLDLPGPVDVADWWPDGSALLLLHEHEGRRDLRRLDLESGELAMIRESTGWISAAGFGPDGEIWLREESPQQSPRVVTVEGNVILAAPGSRPPAGVVRRSMSFPGPEGDPTHMLVSVPEGLGPFPTVMMVHGGPEWAYPDDYDPWEHALVDHGYAVGKVNYRGSTGSTVAFRAALHNGNIGFPEVADVIGGLDLLVAEGIADPSHVAIEGWSWGGYITLLAIGLHPERFQAAIGGIPVCDSVMTHEDCSPPQQEYDMAIMGGSPRQLPELYAERSPSTYLDHVTTPVMLIAGEHDSACPIRQVRYYAEELARRGREVHLHVYDAGHHANSTSEKLHHAEIELAFLSEHLSSSGNIPTDDQTR